MGVSLKIYSLKPQTWDVFQVKLRLGEIILYGSNI